MINPVLILTRNNIELTKRCVESVRGQDIPVNIHIVDNGSMDDTPYFCFSQKDIHFSACGENKGVSYGWNRYIQYNFDKGAEHILVLNNDTILPKWFYSELLSYDFPFVTGVGIGELIEEKPKVCEPQPNPDFSAFLIRREAWEKIGKFDERMKIYSSDQDYHIRGWMAGIPMMKVNAPYYHVNSQTLKRATPEDRAAIELQANLDREELRKKWGVSAGGEDYKALFSEANFGSNKGGLG